MDSVTIKSRVTKGFFEFLLIVIGVTIALWLENLAEDFKEREVEHDYLLSFHTDVAKDIKRLKYTIKNNQVILLGLESFLEKLINNTLSEKELLNNIGSLTN